MDLPQGRMAKSASRELVQGVQVKDEAAVGRDAAGVAPHEYVTRGGTGKTAVARTPQPVEKTAGSRDSLGTTRQQGAKRARPESVAAASYGRDSRDGMDLPRGRIMSNKAQGARPPPERSVGGSMGDKRRAARDKPFVMKVDGKPPTRISRTRKELIQRAHTHRQGLIKHVAVDRVFMYALRNPRGANGPDLQGVRIAPDARGLLHEAAEHHLSHTAELAVQDKGVRTKLQPCHWIRGESQLDSDRKKLIEQRERNYERKLDEDAAFKAAAIKLPTRGIRNLLTKGGAYDLGERARVVALARWCLFDVIYNATLGAASRVVARNSHTILASDIDVELRAQGIRQPLLVRCPRRAPHRAGPKRAKGGLGPPSSDGTAAAQCSDRLGRGGRAAQVSDGLDLATNGDMVERAGRLMRGARRCDDVQKRENPAPA